MRRILLIAFCFVLLLSTAVLAGYNPNGKVAIHVRAHSAKAGCNYGTIIDCHDIVYTMTSAEVDAFPVFFDLTEYRGCEYAITWPIGWGSAAFTSCSDFVIGSITNRGQGASHTWTGDCKTGVMVPSFLWLYTGSSGTICPVGHPQHGFIYTLDCHENKEAVWTTRWGCAGINGAAGMDPCTDLEPVTPTTWSGIKTLFE
jgi:hypothetical protein